MTVFGLALGRIPHGRRPWGLVVGQGLVWLSALILSSTGSLAAVGFAFLLRGAYQGCRSLTQARSSRLGKEGARGLLLGAAETTIASAEIVAPYIAGWLYAANPTRPLHASLVLIPLALVLSVVALPG
jgi:hypothetical protein